MEKMTCPECGNSFNDLDAKILDNGNPVCPKCEEKISENENSENESEIIETTMIEDEEN